MTKNDFEKTLHDTLDFFIYIGDSICPKTVEISSEVFQMKLDISEFNKQYMILFSHHSDRDVIGG